jgi:hypothetical protein
VTVKNLGIRNGQDDGIVVLAHDVTVQGVRIVALRGDVSTGIFASGDGLQLVGNEIRAVGFEGIRVSGSNAVVKGNTVAQAPRGGVHVVGDAARVTSNKVTGANGGVLVAGSGAVVTMNVVERVVGGGLTVVGPDPTVQKNKLINAGTADVECNPCSGGTVSGNASLGSGSYGFAMTANAPGLVVQGNTVTRAAGPAFILNGSQVQARANAATDTGFFGADGFGFMVQGAGHTLTGNKATRCAASGFFVLAANTTLASGTATQAGVSGFTVAPVDGTALIGNTALSSSGAGFAVLPGALNTSVDQNKASKNRYGFCDLGMGTAVGTNNFGVPGVSTNCDMLQ